MTPKNLKGEKIMKKIIALVLAAVMLLSFAACKGGTKVKEPVEILNAVWEKYEENERFFSVGGDYGNMVDNAPAAYDLTADPEVTASQLVCSAENAKMVDSAASLIHGMNANNFTAAVYKMAKGSKPADFITAMEKDIVSNQWICGFPERLLMATIADDYVLIAYGAGDIIETFKGKLTEAYPDTFFDIYKAL